MRPLGKHRISISTLMNPTDLDLWELRYYPSGGSGNYGYP